MVAAGPGARAAAVVPFGGGEGGVGLALQALVLEVVARVVRDVERLLGDEGGDVLVALVVLGRGGVGLARLAGLRHCGCGGRQSCLSSMATRCLELVVNVATNEVSKY